MTAAHYRSELHELIDRVEEQVGELRRHTLRVARPGPNRLRVLESVEGSPAGLGADPVHTGADVDGTAR
jgi:hypothetical protein